MTTVAKINKEFAVVRMPGGHVKILCEQENPITGQIDVEFLSRNDFNLLMANKTMKRKNRKGEYDMNAADCWLSSPDRREYKSIVFAPQGAPKEYYNLYTGFSVEPRKGVCEKFKRHILDVICSGDNKLYRYVMCWLADMFQRPGHSRPGVALVLQGEQGTGKGVFVTQLGKMLGQHFVHISNPQHLVGRFNKHLAKSILVFLDEAVVTRDKAGQATLKALVTEDMLMLEAKGCDAIPVNNFTRLVIASNDCDVVNAALEERRFCVVQVSSKYRQSAKYFKEIIDEMNNGGREALLYELLRIDIAEVNLRDFPRTEALVAQKIASLSNVGKFWYNRLRDGNLTIESSGWEIALSADLYNSFLLFCRQQGIRNLPDESRFFKEILQFCSADRKKISAKDKKSRSWGYVFPSLSECRKAFEEKIEAPLDWDDTDDDNGPAG